MRGARFGVRRGFSGGRVIVITLAIVFVWTAGAAREASAARTQAFRLEGLSDFDKARMNGVALHEDGTVLPGPAATLIAPDAGAQVWTLLRRRDDGIYAASGSDGTVYRISGDQAGRLAETFEYEVFALAQGRDGTVYASGAPNGTIVSIARDGTVRTVFDTPEKIVWALLSDPKGDLYAGTGERGYLYRIEPDGTARVLARVEDDHILSLAWGPDGRLLAGTEGRGLLLSIDPSSGAAKVLYDAPFQEISKIAVAPSGTIYFAAGGAEAPSGGVPVPPTRVTQAIDAVQSGDEEASEGGASTSGPGSSKVFAREPDGTIRAIWDSPESTIHALALDPQTGDLLVGTGNRAALFRVSGEGETTLLWRPEEGQVLSVLPERDAIFAATGNPGRVYKLGPERDGEAWIRPEPLDAKNNASWGRVFWEVLPGAGSWRLRTRSGYTETPDSTWSEWSGLLQDPEGSQVASPPARFLQVEASYEPSGGTPNASAEPARLRRIWIPYTEPNLAPRIDRIRFASDDGGGGASSDAGGGVAYTQDLGGGVRMQIQRAQAQPQPAGEGPPPWVRNVRAVVWEAKDPNGDPLRFDVAIRQVGEEKFRPLARDLDSPSFAIDTGTLPDGSYEVRIHATDAPANPPGEAKEDTRVGGPFRVDHRPPEILDLLARKDGPRQLRIEGRAQDDASPIRRLEVSWDGNPWRPLVPADGFLDSKQEAFQVTIDLDRDEDGSWAAVRAADAAGNEAVQRAWLRP
ncbi:MAG: WD40 repeat domain-containing protein [Candidatus Eisenbacteria bacterium]|nr:WD40 repeat domain-containing protein [Candidatus Eisenbacteria bacterium]